MKVDIDIGSFGGHVSRRDETGDARRPTGASSRTFDEKKKSTQRQDRGRLTSDQRRVGHAKRGTRSINFEFIGSRESTRESGGDVLSSPRTYWVGN